MTQLQMYPAQINSPMTQLSAAIDAVQNTIPLVDASVVPAGPNLCTIGSDETAETISYVSKSGNTLTGVTRGFQSAAKAWGAGAKVARYLTAYDIDAIRNNILDHETRLTAVSSARVTHSAAQSVASGVSLSLAFDTERWDTDNMHDNVTNNTRLTCKTPGKYLAIGYVQFATNTAGFRYISIIMNGATHAITMIPPVQGTDVTRPNVMVLLNMAINDYAELQVLQNSGSPILIGAPNTEFMIVKVGN